MAAENQGHPSGQPGHILPKAKALVIHEEPALFAYYGRVLEELGLEVRTVTTYGAALACLQQELFGFILLNQGSRAFEGRCVLERVREISPQTSVLVVTRCRDVAIYLEAMQLGAVDYLEEPVSLAEMKHAATAHLHAATSAM